MKENVFNITVKFERVTCKAYYEEINCKVSIARILLRLINSRGTIDNAPLVSNVETPVTLILLRVWSCKLCLYSVIYGLRTFADELRMIMIIFFTLTQLLVEQIYWQLNGFSTLSKLLCTISRNGIETFKSKRCTRICSVL